MGDQLFSDSDGSNDPGPVDLPDHSDGQSDMSCNENEKTELPKKNGVRTEKPAAFDSDEWDDFCAGEALGGSDLGDGNSEEEVDSDSDSSNSGGDSKSEDESLEKRMSKKRKKQQNKVRRSYSQDDSSESESEEERHPMVKINAAEIKMEPEEQGSPKKTSRPKKKI